VTVVQGIEGMEEFLLRALLAGEELDVVDHQHVRLPVFLPEFDESAVLNGVDELVGELLAGDVENLRTLAGGEHVVADGLQQVRFAESAAAVDEKRVVGLGWRLRDGEGRGVGELIVRADDECVEIVAGVHPAGEGRGAFLAWSRAHGLGLLDHVQRRAGLHIVRLPGHDHDLAGRVEGLGDRALHEGQIIALEEELVNGVRDRKRERRSVVSTDLDIAEPTLKSISADPGGDKGGNGAPNGREILRRK